MRKTANVRWSALGRPHVPTKVQLENGVVRVSDRTISAVNDVLATRANLIKDADPLLELLYDVTSDEWQFSIIEPDYIEVNGQLVDNPDAKLK